MIGAVGAAIAQIDWERLKSALPIEYVRVEGPVWHLDAEEFRGALMSQVRLNYFMADLDGIEATAKQFAWVDKAQAARVWPNTLVVRVEEQHPIARWDEDSLLNDRGERFTPKDVTAFGALPQLSGPPGQEKQVLGMMYALNAKLQARWLRIESLRLSKRLAWVARLEGGMEVVFGNQDPLAAMDRLLALLPRLGEDRIADIQKLDLRYPNGFSVVWKPEPQAPPDSISQIRELAPLDSGSV
ncbi:MAG: cell division protein FtsQ/DivIB [Methylomagnum sp.]